MRSLETKPRQRPMTPEMENNDLTPPSKPPSLFLPYIKGLSKKIQTTCQKIGVRAIFKSSLTLRQLLTNVKTRTPDVMKKEVVYGIPCHDCETSYIGETNRSLRKRIAEHKYAMKSNDRKNGIAVHAWDNQ